MGFQQGAPTLADLGPGQEGRVASVEGGDALSLRLLEMGLTPGARVHLLKRAPFGDPVELRVRGFHLTVRKAEARRVRLEPDVKPVSGPSA